MRSTTSSRSNNTDDGHHCKTNTEIQTASALHFNIEGVGNAANGSEALSHNTTGNLNIALGVHAGENLTTGDNNIVEMRPQLPTEIAGVEWPLKG